MTVLIQRLKEHWLLTLKTQLEILKIITEEEWESNKGKLSEACIEEALVPLAIHLCNLVVIPWW